jgi:glycine cleavage system H lipoate-binding protein/ABC-type phosphate transport system substrate-binding protein
MKKSMFLFIVLMAASVSFAADIGKKEVVSDDASLKGTLTVACSPDLYNLAGNWTDAFSKANPGVKINLVKVSQGSDFLSDPANDLSIVSADYRVTEPGAAPWRMIVGRDIVVPVISKDNPYSEAIALQGLSPEFMAGLFNESGKTWNDATGSGSHQTIQVWVADNQSVRSGLMEYLGINDASKIQDHLVPFSTLEEKMKSDPNAVGFCRLTDLTGNENESSAILSLLPIDKNGNGKIDYVENIYSSIPAFVRGVWIGKYPRSLARPLIAYSDDTPTDDATLGLLRFIAGEGQNAVENSGLISLLPNERKSKLENLPLEPNAQLATVLNPWQVVITIAVALVLVLLVASMFIRINRKQVRNLSEKKRTATGSLGENSILIPRGLYYDRTHTWAFMEASGNVKIGMDDFLQHVTGQGTRILMKKPGDKVIKGDPVMTMIQKGKQLILHAPVSGIIRAQNTLLFTDPSLINRSPYTDGWLYQIEPTNWINETQLLLMADTYAEWIRGEFRRLKEFLTTIVKPESPDYAYAILQDGGEITDHVLENLEPEVWEEFQSKFMDKANQTK